MEKKCPKCKKVKELNATNFYRSSYNKNGFDTYCKDCKNSAKNGYENENKTRISAYNQVYYENRREEISNRRKKIYQEKHKDEIEARKLIPKITEDEKRKRARDYQIKNKEKLSEYNKKRYKENPIKEKLRHHWRSARKKELPDTLTKEQWDFALKFFDYSCAYCNKRVDYQLALDHVIPITSNNCPGTVVTNSLPVCKSCNSSKNNKNLEEWIVSRFEDGIERLKHILDYFNFIEYSLK